MSVAAAVTVSRNWPVPLPAETPYLLNTVGAPALAFIAVGDPAPQGSKTAGRRKNGTVFVRESSKAVSPWRAAVAAQAKRAAGAGWKALDDDRGGVLLDLVFTMKRPVDRPKRLRCRPAVTPDLDKLVRSTLDALTAAEVLADDARVVAFRRLDEFYVGDPDQDTLPQPGVLVRVWPLPLESL
jgi:Holliday junction resolvase RusA-like endonuclease